MRFHNYKGIEVAYNEAEGGFRFIGEVLEKEWYRFGVDPAERFETVIDIGANIGTFSIFIYDLAEKIYAIEPIPNHLNLLKETIAKNDLKKIKTFELAITDTDGEDSMSYDPIGGASQVGGHNLDNYLEMVKTQKIGTFMKENGIETVDLMKVDIEGSEYRIFQDQSFIENCHKIKKIIGEFHDSAMPVDSLLIPLGYQCTAKDMRFIATR